MEITPLARTIVACQMGITQLFGCLRCAEWRQPKLHRCLWNPLEMARRAMDAADDTVQLRPYSTKSINYIMTLAEAMRGGSGWPNWESTVHIDSEQEFTIIISNSDNSFNQQYNMSFSGAWWNCYPPPYTCIEYTDVVNDSFELQDGDYTIEILGTNYANGSGVLNVSLSTADGNTAFSTNANHPPQPPSYQPLTTTIQVDETFQLNSCTYDDACGVCDGDNSTCLDACGVPNGDNSTCADLCGVLMVTIPAAMDVWTRQRAITIRCIDPNHYSLQPKHSSKFADRVSCGLISSSDHDFQVSIRNADNSYSKHYSFDYFTYGQGENVPNSQLLKRCFFCRMILIPLQLQVPAMTPMMLMRVQAI